MASEQTMARRAWILVLLGILIPGTPQLLAGSKPFGRFAVRSTFVLWAIVAVAIVLNFMARATLVTLATNFIVLIVVQVAIVFYGLLWVILAIDTMRHSWACRYSSMSLRGLLRKFRGSTINWRSFPNRCGVRARR